MSEVDRSKDYYEILGADRGATHRELEQLYKRMAARLHPDKGGDEEEMKSLNEAYRVLKDPLTRSEYDSKSAAPPRRDFVPVAAAAARDVGLLGHGLSAFFCLLMGVFLLVLVRSQWIWFLWPLAILSLFVIGFGVMMARGAMRALNMSLHITNPVRRHSGVQEAAFWALVAASGYMVYLLLTNF